jgi:hypothetical protein
MWLVTATIALTTSGAANTMACDLKLEPSQVFANCQVVVGYYNGTRVGPFHIALPDGSVVTAGSCSPFVHVRNVTGNVVDLDAFGSVPAGQYTLRDDCRSSAKTR